MRHERDQGDDRRDHVFTLAGQSVFNAFTAAASSGKPDA